MAGLRAILRAGFVHALLGRLIALYVRFVRLTSRWEVRGTETRDRLRRENGAMIIALWHNRIAMTPYGWPEEAAHITALTSAHPDGRFVSRTLRRFGMNTFEIDSRSGGGTQALRVALRLLRQGEIVAITPDGPRGPRMRVRDGLVHIAARSGVPVLPLTCSPSRRRVLGSWDRFILPLPFSRIHVHYGEPVAPPTSRDPEAMADMRRRMEAALTELSDACDRAAGFDPIAPAEPPADPAADMAAGDGADSAPGGDREAG